MERLFRAQHVNLHPKELEKPQVDEAIELDNRAFDIVDGDKKMLDYLNYSGTITKGSLAANGVIKLYPDRFDKFKGDYGAMANPIRPQISPPVDKEEDISENEWDNIFLKNDYQDDNFFAKPQTCCTT